MRDSKRKSKRKDSNDEEEKTRPGSLEMELELISMKGKNANFVQAHKKLLEENADLKNEVLILQAELVNMQAKYNNLDFIYKNLEQNMKRCTPNLIDILNLFLQVADKRTDSCHMSDQTSVRGFTPKAKAVTHTVKPHTVNGTVLNLVPTISLTRLNTSSSNELNEVSTSNQNEDYRNSLPSTSADGDNVSPSMNAAEVGDHSFVSKRNSSKNSIPTTSEAFVNGSLQIYEDNDEDDDEEMEEQDSDLSDQEEENAHRLSTIREESFTNTTASARKRTSLGEVRIYLSRLSAEDMQVRRSQNSSFSSTTPNVNDTRLDIETTIIENSENIAGKTLRADIMVFSPHTNSTRMENNNSALNDFSPSPRNTSKTLNASAMSDIQSSEVTPSTSLQIEANNDLSTNSNKVAWLPTPSLSAMGDIDNSTTKLDILKESEKNDNNEEESPPDEQPVTPQRYTKSSGRSRTKSVTKTQGESPKSSTADQEEARESRSLARQKRNISSRPLTPTIVLERLESIRPERSLTASTINIQITAQEGLDENDKSPVKRQTRSKKRKASAKSPKRSVKPKIKREKVSEVDNSLENKIREIQIRLSNYCPEATETPIGSPKLENGRPKRAARPTSLKDASLKGKLRRMF